MSKLLVLFFVLTILLGNSLQSDKAAQAQESAKRYTAKSMVASMDKNGDGKISKEEAPADLKKNFGYVDTNQDGSIDIKEAQAMADYANNEKTALEKAAIVKSAEAKPKTTKGITAKQFIAALDKDEDGKVSKNETFGKLETNFTYIDSSGDGFVDTAEAQAALNYAKENGLVFDLSPTISQPKTTADPDAPTPEQTIAKLDKNGDGKITLREAPEDLRLFFGNYDTNDDGSIDKKEAEALIAYLKNGASQTVQSHANKPASRTPSSTPQTVMKQMDLDSDGKITKDEAPEALKQTFAYVDTNNDGAIDLKEAQAIADFMNKQNK